MGDKDPTTGKELNETLDQMGNISIQFSFRKDLSKTTASGGCFKNSFSYISEVPEKALKERHFLTEQDALKALASCQRSPSPVPHEDRVEEKLTREGFLELVRRQKRNIRVEHADTVADEVTVVREGERRKITLDEKRLEENDLTWTYSNPGASKGCKARFYNVEAEEGGLESNLHLIAYILPNTSCKSHNGAEDGGLGSHGGEMIFNGLRHLKLDVGNKQHELKLPSRR
ncbi:hypothetical protein GQ43DRAFT_466799 [Delitschia confertaspora ATCC 74209]|uniref:Uncharacterized protein n=1 Tax=Delitschia confertaspora ATCC 74209 TaxID=1513339 RepID=A0A9P4JI50_9PLEO|nr:hypothetical protein GQ43DRAFT_466799 [Delitschia confertaspora ATCC 74209]